MSDNPWRTAVPDWEARLLAGTSLVPTLPLFQDEAERALRVFKRLRIPDMVGTPRIGDCTGQWVFDIVAAMFGSFDLATQIRMVQELFLLVPKKNTKTSTASEIILTAGIINERPQAELLLVAPTKEIANISYRQIAGSIDLDPELDKLFHKQQHLRTITHRNTEATIVVKAADTDVITGSKSTWILVDETHVFAKKPRAAEVFVEIRGALASRPDGCMIQITTQSKEQPVGVFKQELAIARDVRDGKLDLPMLAVLYELPDRLSKDGGWKAESTWPLVNPNYGRSVRPDFLRQELVKAERSGDKALALLASQHFNVEIGLLLREDSWVGASSWQKAGDSLLTLDALLERSEVACVGIDGGGADDLLGIAVIGRERETHRWLHWGHAFAHPLAIKRRMSEETRYLDFFGDGDLTIITTYPEDIEGVVAIVKRVKDAGLLGGVGLDQIGIGGVVDALADIGVTDEDKTLIGVSQGYRLTGAIKTVERKLVDGSFVHGDRPMMAWCLGNAKVEPTKNAFLITKQASGTMKIDPLMALFDAAALMERNPEPKGASVYEQHGLMFF